MHRHRADGLWDWLKSTPKHTQAWRTANLHMGIRLTTTVVVIVDVLARLGDETVGSLVLLSVIAGALVTWEPPTGALVYDYAFNVETSGDHPVCTSPRPTSTRASTTKLARAAGRRTPAAGLTDTGQREKRTRSTSPSTTT
jgi:hypothetical protein